MMNKILTIDILPCSTLPTGIDVFTYLCNPDAPPVIGQICIVPFGKQEILGVIVGAPKLPTSDMRLKPIKEILPLPPLTQATLDFIDKFADYNMIKRGTVLKMMIALATKALPTHETHYQLMPDIESIITEKSLKLTAMRQKFITEAKNLPPLPLKTLHTETAVSVASIKKMQEIGMIKTITQQQKITLPDYNYQPPDFSNEQQKVKQAMQPLLDDGTAILLDGETGSGKTLLYFDAVAKILQQGKQVLILLPEIILTRQFVALFETYFGIAPLLWHSSQSEATRKQIWQHAIHGTPVCVMGARSALLLPFQNLGLIIVDEEHDSSYKQSEGNIYHARDMAVLRAKLNHIPIVLASATPSLESMVNADKGRYHRLMLKQRYGGFAMPDIHLIDVRKEKYERGKFISAEIIKHLQMVLDEKQQAILYLNRRGFAPLLLCRSCGYRFMCQSCDAWLVAHYHINKLQCHHCGFQTPLADKCPDCESDDLLPCGPGIERIADEVNTIFPDANVALMSSDHIKQREHGEQLITAMQQSEIDILIGTQILTKGFHFANLSFVGVIDADLSLAGGDLRAGEHTYQLLHQVMGRAGREQHGTVMLQTTNPEHILFQSLASGKRDEFYQSEKEFRKQGNWPPFGRMAMIILKGNHQEKLYEFAKSLKQNLPQANHIAVLGPALAPLARVNNQWQIRFLLRTHRNFLLQQFINDWLARVKKPSAIHLKIDIDPL